MSSALHFLLPPHKLRAGTVRQNPDKIRNVLNILFMVLALAAIIIYFAAKDDFKLFIYVCGAAIFVKLMEFFIRFTNR